LFKVGGGGRGAWLVCGRWYVGQTGGRKQRRTEKTKGKDGGQEKKARIAF
jgi:hypothetical protein